MPQTIQGGCFCGALRYRFSLPIVASVNCHCSMCRKTSAAPFVSWLVVPVAQFHYDVGEAKLLQSSKHGQRSFCGHCGTPVVCTNDAHPQWVDVTLGSLDDPEQFPPSQDVYADSRLSWVPALPTKVRNDS